MMVQYNMMNGWNFGKLYMILGIQKNGYPVVMPDPHLTIRKDDVIWVMGSNNNVGRLAAFSVCPL